MTAVAGIMAQPQDFHSVKGMAVNQMTKNLEVCLQHRHDCQLNPSCEALAGVNV